MSIKWKLVHLKVAVLIFYGCLLITLSIFKTAEIMLPVIYQIEGVLGGDKLTHLILSSVLTLVALWALVPDLFVGLGLKVKCWICWCLGVCALLTFGLLIDELHQALVSSRRFEWLDIAYGVGGIGIGLTVFIIINLPKLTYKYD